MMVILVGAFGMAMLATIMAILSFVQYGRDLQRELEHQRRQYPCINTNWHDELQKGVEARLRQRCHAMVLVAVCAWAVFAAWFFMEPG